MFKKTLIAVALAAVSTGAMAVDVATSTTSFTYGNEALVNGTVKNDFTQLTLNTIQLDLGASYTVGDTLVVNVTGGEFKTSDTFALVSSNAAHIEAGFLSATANSLTFRITTVGGTEAEVKAANFTLVAPKIKLASTAVGSKVIVSAAAATSTGIAIDVAGDDDSVVAGSVIQEHKFSITSANLLSKKIDVADERKSLVGTTDTATVTYDNTVASFVAARFTVAGADQIKVTVNGSFTGFEAGVSGSTNLGAVKIDTNAVVVASDLQSASDSFTLGAVDKTFPILFTPDAAPATRKVLNTGTYSADIAITDGTKTTTYADIAMGGFVLNGASKTFGYVPVNFDGAVVSQFEIGNKGTVDGEITITAFDRDGGKHSAVVPFKATAGKMTKLSDTDISTAFGLTKGASLNLTITVNSPDADITISGYSNRGTTGRMSLSAVN